MINSKCNFFFHKIYFIPKHKPLLPVKNQNKTMIKEDKPVLIHSVRPSRSAGKTKCQLSKHGDSVIPYQGKKKDAGLFHSFPIPCHSTRAVNRRRFETRTLLAAPDSRKGHQSQKVRDYPLGVTSSDHPQIFRGRGSPIRVLHIRE